MVGMSDEKLEQWYEKLIVEPENRVENELIEFAEMVVETYPQGETLSHKEATKIIKFGGVILHEKFGKKEWGEITFEKLDEYGVCCVNNPDIVGEVQPDTWEEMRRIIKEYNQLHSVLTNGGGMPEELHREVIGNALPHISDTYNFSK